MKNVFKSLAVVAVLFLSAGLVMGQQKIGHVNYAEIFTATPEYVKAETELRGIDSAKTMELQSMFTIYQTKMNEREELLRNRSAANSETTDPKIQSLEMEMAEFEKRLNEQQRIAEEEITQRQQQLFMPIHQKVGTAIQAVAKEKGYAYVFDVSSTNIPYFEGGDDLSADVKTKLGLPTS